MKVAAIAGRSPGWDLVEMHQLNANLGDAAGLRANAPRDETPAGSSVAQPRLALVHPQWRPAQWRRPRMRANQNAQRDSTVGLHEDAGLPGLHATQADDRLYGRVPADSPVDQPIHPDAAHRARTGSEWASEQAGPGGVQQTVAPSSSGAIVQLAIRLAQLQRQRCLSWMLPMGSAA